MISSNSTWPIMKRNRNGISLFLKRKIAFFETENILLFLKRKITGPKCRKHWILSDLNLAIL